MIKVKRPKHILYCIGYKIVISSDYSHIPPDFSKEKLIQMLEILVGILKVHW